MSGFTTPPSLEDLVKVTRISNEWWLAEFIKSLKNSVKPIVGLVRGKGIGIGFTMTAHFDFVYCDPNASFKVPFMASAQAPEGGSTFTFPQ